MEKLKEKEIQLLALKQPNIISKALYESSITSTSYKLIRYGLFVISNSKKINDYKVKFTVSEFCKCLGIKQGGNQNLAIQKALNELTKARFIFQDDEELNKIGYLVWVHTAIRNENIITLEFNPNLIKYSLANIKQYSYLELKTIGKIKSIYSLRIYELLKSFYNTKGEKYHNKKNEWRTEAYTIPELRKIFCCEDKYSKEADFIQRCIKNSIKEINEACEFTNLNFSVSYEVFEFGAEKYYKFVGTEIIFSEKLEYNKNDTPEIREDKKEMVSDNVELINFKKKYTVEEWEKYKKELQEKNKFASHMEDGPFLDSSIMEYIKNKLQDDLF